MEKKQLKFIDMFAGIGGFRSGMAQAGMKPVGYIEWNKFARKCYQAMYNTEGEFEANDIQKVKGIDLPNADIWTFGSPCQDVSVAGRQEGLVKGKQSSMFFEVIRLAKERIAAKKSLPRYLWLENVKNLLSSNRGRDFARVLIEMDKIGYDVEWSVIDSARFVPQHRERIYVIGHLREDGKRSQQIFPLGRENADFAQTSKIKVVANDSKTGYRSHDVVDESGISKTIDATSYKHKPLVRVKQLGNYRLTKSFGGNPQTGRVYDKEGLSPTLNTMQGGDRQPKILDKIKVRPTLTPERVNKRQMGRRFKQDGEPSFTLTAEDRHGVMLEDDTQEPTKYVIRKLTPRECWRLQGFTDKQFDKAQQAGVSDSQLYARAGNAVTVPVIKAIADKIVANENDETDEK